mgnify:CR=1 FL=1
MGIAVRHIASFVVGLTFIFSGFVKSVDPVGTSIFVEKYLATYGLESLLPASVAIGVVLGTVELMLGLMLVCGAYRKVASFGAMLFLFVFTIVTLLSATILPIGDCGCFGDAVKLTPWQTFGKNVILLPLAFVAWLSSRRVAPQRYSMEATIVVALLSLMLNLASLRFQPLVDFLHYKVGVNLRDEVQKSYDAEANSVVVYLQFRDKTTGEIIALPSDDPRCWTEYDDYVDSYSVAQSVEQSPFADFRLFADGDDVTLSLLNAEGQMLWVTIFDADALVGSRLRAVQRIIDSHPDDVVVVTSDSVERVSTLVGVSCYAMDAMTLRSLVRSKVGVVVVEDGVIVDKWNVLDFQDRS